ncbi:MAG: threonine synthase [candidate division NC10 bacterium RBG_16_65_8]|nr:MAG: threonine synthase [candidate division NC10 bacterium RBG_16_65_8]
MAWQGLIHRYREHLPITDATPVVTLNEGNTPLIRADRLRQHLGLACEVFLKYEGLNPTGSFKDRGMTVAISKALERGAKAVICASTGNTSASAAAYAARAGIRAFVLIPEGKIALGKLAQAMFHGAQVLQIRGNFDDALRLVREVSEKHPVVLVNSVNPDRIEGQKTGAFEVCEQLGEAPTYQFMPVGNAGNITAYWRGYREYHKLGKIARLPRMIGWQAEGAAPIVLGRVVEKPETIASAIRIGNPASWQGATDALRESEGAIDVVSDEEILGAYGLLAQLEGVFCEPASAASAAGLVKWVKTHGFTPSDRVVLILTGHGLKDPDTAVTRSARPVTVEAGMGPVMEALKL